MRGGAIFLGKEWKRKERTEIAGSGERQIDSERERNRERSRRRKGDGERKKWRERGVSVVELCSITQ